jgi:hypothetical protein
VVASPQVLSNKTHGNTVPGPAGAAAPKKYASLRSRPTRRSSLRKGPGRFGEADPRA